MMTKKHLNWVDEKERTSEFWLRLIRGLALRMPRSLVKPLLHPIVLFYLLISKKQKHASKHYLRQALGRQPRFKDVYLHFLYFSTTILDRVYFLTGRISPFDVKYSQLHEFHDALKVQKSVLLFGAHFGSLDAIRAIAMQPIKVVMKIDHNESLVKLLNELNPNLIDHVIPYNGLETVFNIHDNLSSGQAVAMLKDRQVGNESTVEVQFFGDKMDVPVAGFKLAKRFGYPVWLFYGRYEGGNSYYVVHKPLVISEEMSVKDIAQAYMDCLAEQCRLSPYNWFNFYPYWKVSSEPTK